ncbi:iron-siderophore ABC transporter substrate-binding protein [Blastococcus sp. Marseille-P5729]|uniref:ABC transporter substrate-binding protein n=1 Tax=Blastococcus sp. Marseille-P5729 TaxID=2086582 RepID=UPI000D11054A|nr:iron-siderophore ABC transporter substrate-binding protein [Blastococcus sp. Marseille-P5729]
MRTMRRLLPALLTVLTLALTACGTTDEAADERSGQGGEKITVTDARGKEVTLDGPATRVVTLEWQQTEDVLALGVEPAGIADIKGFQAWDTAVEVAGDPVDVGLRAEPSAESIGKADPDLILGVKESIPEGALEQMEQMAPVVLLESADANAPIEQVRENFETTAKLLGKSEKGAEILAELDQTLADAKTQIASADPAPYAFAYVYGEGNQVSFRMHATRSIPGAIAEQLGLQNAFTGPGDDAWGLQTYDLEAMTTLPADTHLLYWADPEGDPVKDLLSTNPVWANLPYVQSGAITEFGDGIWMYGGPRSLQQLAEAYVKVFAS